VLYYVWIYPSSAGSRLSGSYSLFPGVYLAEEVDRLGDKGSGDITIFDLHALVEAFLNVFLRSACSVHGNFLVEHAFQFWDHSPPVLDYQDF
jgi:hypothetical protein